MILWQRIEGAIIAALAFTLLLLMRPQLPLMTPELPLWLLITLFFVPDLAIVGYLAGPRAGAFFYNLMHLYPMGVLPFFLGLVFGHSIAVALGVLMIAHVGVDRALGFGLKSSRGFIQTHLGANDHDK